jgi:hypothetical protein
MPTILALPTGTIGAAATVLLDLLSDLVDLRLGPSSRLASTFIAPLRPDDIYELAERLDNVTDAIDDVGDLVFLGHHPTLDP